MSGTETNTIEVAGDRDLSGCKLGDYELIRRLGRGGMADVYLARQVSLGRPVALKVLKSTLAADEKYIRRFQQEARAAASLVHANIVQIHEVGFRDGVHFIAQEYVQGQNLRQFLQRHGPVDAATALRILRQVAAALHRSGEQSIIHRDIKPENIMLASTGEVKVADFGLARAEDSQELGLTQVGVTMGTPLYMSPEQVQARTIDPRSDIYSLGATCLHMLAGRPPFEGDTALSVAVQHLNNEPTRLEQLRKDLPPGLCRIIHKMLEKQVSDRYQSAAELLRDLRTIRIESDGNEIVVEEWTDAELDAMANSRHATTQQLAAVMSSQAMRATRSRRKWLLIAAAVCIAFLGGGLIGWANRPAPLLTTSAQPTAVPRYESAEEQYRFAQIYGTKDAFLSVERYFKPENNFKNRYYVRLAWEELGRIYLEEDELDRAMAVYERLANSVEETEDTFYAKGVAGQAMVLWRRGETQEAAKRLANLAPLLLQLDAAELRGVLEQLDPELRRRVALALKEGRA